MPTLKIQKKEEQLLVCIKRSLFFKVTLKEDLFAIKRQLMQRELSLRFKKGRMSSKHRVGRLKEMFPGVMEW